MGTGTYTGPPSEERIAAIHSLTISDPWDLDRVLFRKDLSAPWRPLRSDGDYRELNAAVDRIAPREVKA